MKNLIESNYQADFSLWLGKAKTYKEIIERIEDKWLLYFQINIFFRVVDDKENIWC